MFSNSVRSVPKSSHTYVCWTCQLRSTRHVRHPPSNRRCFITPATDSPPKPTEDALILGGTPLREEDKKKRHSSSHDGKQTSTKRGDKEVLQPEHASPTTSKTSSGIDGLLRALPRQEKEKTALKRPGTRTSGESFQGTRLTQNLYTRDVEDAATKNAPREGAKRRPSSLLRPRKGEKETRDQTRVGKVIDLLRNIIEPRNEIPVDTPATGVADLQKPRLTKSAGKTVSRNLRKKLNESYPPITDATPANSEKSENKPSKKTNNSAAGKAGYSAREEKKVQTPDGQRASTAEKSWNESPTPNGDKPSLEPKGAASQKPQMRKSKRPTPSKKATRSTPSRKTTRSIPLRKATRSKIGLRIMKIKSSAESTFPSRPWPPAPSEKLSAKETAAENLGRQEAALQDAQTIASQDITISPLDAERPPVPNLSYGLERVLFNPGVYHLQDPRSQVFNFDPYLQKIMPVSEFDFDSLKEYITSSRDHFLRDLAMKNGRKYIGSSSSMTSVLAHFHFLLSQWREINVDMLSRGFPAVHRSFTKLQRGPSAIFLRWKDGVYAIDADKEFDSANVLMSLGKSMEKLLTLPTTEFERYRKSSEMKVSEDERAIPEAYHYSTSGDFLMRSQLDAHDERLPGTGMFDLKTRAVVSIRMDAKNYEQGMGYQIKDRFGEWESYEREYFDMIRSAFLKYSLQVRMGRMDGIFVAFHNIERIFGFQYIPLSEMDQSLHGDPSTKTGDEEFGFSIKILNKVLDRAIEKFPETSLRLHFETRETQSPFMYIFAEPVTEDQIESIQMARKQEIEEFERTILGLQSKEAQISEQSQDIPNAAIDPFQNPVEGEIQNLPVDQVSKDADSSQERGTSDSPPSSDALSGGNLGAQGPMFANVKPDITADDEIKPGSDGTVEGSSEGEETSAIVESNTAVDDEIQPGLDSTLEASSEGEETSAFVESNTAADNEIKLESDGTVEASVEREQSSAIAESNTAEVNEADSEVVSNSEDFAEEGDSDAPADAPFLDTVAPSRDSPEGRPLLGLTLSIQNKVNKRKVKRPEKLQADQNWSVEYQISEIKEKRSHQLYDMCKRRRKLQLADREQEEGTAVNFYLRRLRDLSSQGQQWREEQERQNHGKEHVVLSRP